MWVYLVGGGSTANVFLWDLEAPDTCTSAFACPREGTGRICNSAGRRPYLSGPTGSWVKSDLGKWCIPQDFQQIAGQELSLPADQWVRLRVYMRMSERSDGIMKVWQGDSLGDHVAETEFHLHPPAGGHYGQRQCHVRSHGVSGRRQRAEPVPGLVRFVTVNGSRTYTARMNDAEIKIVPRAVEAIEHETPPRVPALISALAHRHGFEVKKLAWASGLMIVVRMGRINPINSMEPHETQMGAYENRKR